ncbi:MAG: hypothetical protein AAFY31_04380 [Pseudomonadota bacterium]
MIRAALIWVVLATPAAALTLGDCRRITHVSHGGAAGHVDFGAGRVGWVDWWSMEGVFTDFTVADCKTGKFLRTRVREERMSPRPPFDRREAVRGIIETEMQVAAALFSFERLRDAIHPKGKDIEVAVRATEPCACAAAYPELRGSKTPYEVSE